VEQLFEASFSLLYMSYQGQRSISSSLNAVTYLIRDIKEAIADKMEHKRGAEQFMEYTAQGTGPFGRLKLLQGTAHLAEEHS
jgi:hypothetical protein